MTQACASMLCIFRDDLKVGLRADALAAFGSSARVARALGNLLGGVAGQVATGAVGHGADSAPGQARCAKNARWKRRSCIECMFKRHRKLQKHRRRLPRRK
eukprot:4490858-Pyramimonas_sp.AAC.1